MHARVLPLVVAAISVPVWAQEPVPLGDDFQVNSYTTDYQVESSVAVAGDGSFVVSWTSYSSPGTDTDSRSVLARRFDSEGTPLGADFQVNTYTTSEQRRPSIAAADNGDFVIVWQSYGSPGTDTSGWSVQGQRFAADGTPRGSEFQVNSNTLGGQLVPSVAAEGDGDFVVVWNWITFIPGVQGQRFAADGTPVGGEFQVNSSLAVQIEGPEVGLDGAGNFVVVWKVQGLDGPPPGSDISAGSIRGRRFGAGGLPLGDDFQINTYTTDNQDFALVGVADDGSFVVAWRSEGSGGTDTDITSIQARRFSTSGLPLENDFQVNVTTSGAQLNPSLTVHPEGGFIVVWDSPFSAGTDNSSTSVQGRAFAADGSPLGGEFQVNSYTTSRQEDPAVAIDLDGQFVVTWTGYWDLFGDEKTNIDARGFSSALVSSVIFADGFESGDTSAWSLTFP